MKNWRVELNGGFIMGPIMFCMGFFASDLWSGVLCSGFGVALVAFGLRIKRI